eukprot:RCo042062
MFTRLRLACWLLFALALSYPKFPLFTLEEKPTCGSVKFSCPAGFAAKTVSTVCSSQACNILDCCGLPPVRPLPASGEPQKLLRRTHPEDLPLPEPYEFAHASGNATCGSAHYTCPPGLVAKTAATACSTPNCNLYECCYAMRRVCEKNFVCPYNHVSKGANIPCASAAFCTYRDCCAALFSWSTPGETRGLGTPTVPFGPRGGHCAVTFNDRLFVIAGANSRGVLGDVWSSADGLVWVLSTKMAGFGARKWLTCAVLGSQLFVLGGRQGYSPSTSLSDVWGSSSGFLWTMLDPGKRGFGPRSGHSTVAFQERLWVVAGLNIEGRLLNDVWSSGSGVAESWTEADVSLPVFPARAYAGLTVFRNQMWLVAGCCFRNDVWASPDGSLWTRVTSNGPFPSRTSLVLASFGEQLWVVGGERLAGSAYADAWASNDGMFWVAQPSLPVPITSAAGAVLRDALFTTGGTSPTAPVEVVYSLAKTGPRCETFDCPLGFPAKSPLTVCSASECSVADCCAVPLGCFADSPEKLALPEVIASAGFTPQQCVQA